jgi:hypothetical protein
MSAGPSGSNVSAEYLQSAENAALSTSVRSYPFK